MKLTARQLRKILKYDYKSGEFTWLVSPTNSVKAGSRAGYNKHCGYRGIAINKKQYLAHRLAWLYMTGRWPDFILDHKDRNASNNRWSNIRQSNPTHNQRNRKNPKNNKSGYPGVQWHKRSKKWQVHIRAFGKQNYGGSFENINEAIKKRKQMEKFYGFEGGLANG